MNIFQVIFNPKDTSSFASASLDRTVKVWSIGQPTPNFTLEGHEKGVNCVDYFSGGDRPYLLSGADDKVTKVWDYQTKACVQVCMSHPMLPVRRATFRFCIQSTLFSLSLRSVPRSVPQFGLITAGTNQLYMIGSLRC